MVVIDFTASIVTAGGLRQRIEALRQAYSPDCADYFNEIMRRRGAAFCDSASGFLLLDSLLQGNKIDRAAVPIIFGLDNRPHIASPDLDFSISHSEGCAFCALAIGENANIGCDVQRVRDYSTEQLDKLAGTFMNARELESFAKSADKTVDFFKAWTRRESYVKRVGSDIFDNLSCADISGEIYRDGVISACGRRYFYSINYPANDTVLFAEDKVFPDKNEV